MKDWKHAAMSVGCRMLMCERKKRFEWVSGKVHLTW